MRDNFCMDGVNFYIRKVYNIKYSIFWISKIKNIKRCDSFYFLRENISI